MLKRLYQLIWFFTLVVTGAYLYSQLYTEAVFICFAGASISLLVRRQYEIRSAKASAEAKESAQSSDTL